jgi:hypothetical protein
MTEYNSHPRPDKFAVTVFPDKHARVKHERFCTPDELLALIRDTHADKKAALPHLKLARFGNKLSRKGSLRHNANVLGIIGVEIDHDAGSMAVEEAVRRLCEAGVLSIIYTSPRHHPDHPRWRVLAFFRRELAPDEHPTMTARLNGILGGAAADESFTLSQSYYYGSCGNPHHQAVLVEGTPLDLHDELDAGALGKSRSSPTPRGGRSGRVDEAGLMAQICRSESYHPPAIMLAAAWAYQGLSLAQAAKRLLKLFDAVPEASRDDRWRERRAEVPDILTWVYAREHAAMRAQPAPDGGGRIVDLEQLKVRVPKLAAVTPAEYETARLAAAKEIGIAAGRLDAMVRKERNARNDSDELSGQAVTFPRDVPWTEVDGLTDLLNDFDEFLQKMMVMSESQRLAFMLWCVFTHALDAFDHSPRLLVKSALKRSGKTRLLSIARGVTAKGLLAVSVSLSSLFRIVHECGPCLIMDEADVFLGRDDPFGLRSIINGGFDRSDAKVLRTEGERTRKVRSYDSWCCVAMGMIGNAPGTVEDRSVALVLSRKSTGEKVARFGRAERAKLVEFRRRAASWAAAHMEELRQADPDVPEELNDRAHDVWAPLIAVAAAGGTVLGEQARAAAVKLAEAHEGDTREIEVQALADIVPWVDANPKLTEAFTEELAAYLATLEERPWPEFGRKREPITKSRLARLLTRIGLVSTNVWRKADPPKTTKDRSARGYTRETLECAFLRYGVRQNDKATK